jgi:hypothetical protein
MKTMKRIARILLSVAVAVSAAMTASAQIKITASDYIAEDAAVLDLEKHDGKVIVSFDIEVGEKFIKSSEMCVITPMFVNGAFEDKLPQVVLEGKKYALLAREAEKFDKILALDDLKRVVYGGKGTSIHYQLVISYTPEYKDATLLLKCETYKVCGKRTAEQSINLANGIARDADYIEPAPVFYCPQTVCKSYVNDFGNHSVFHQGKTPIDFPAFLANGYSDLACEVKRLEEDVYSSILSIKVETSASPEGPLSLNARLAQERAMVIRKQLVDGLKLDESLVTCEWVDENWDAFLTELPCSGLADIARIHQIIEQNSDLDKREAELKKLDNYPEIYRIFQNLRNCKVTIDYSTLE